MPSLLEYLQTAWPRVRDDALLLALPVVGTVLQFGNVVRVLNAGPGGGVTFAFPTGFATLWSFVNVPTGDGLVANPLLFAFGVAVQAALTAVYVPRAVERVRPGRGEADPAAALRRYFAPLFGVAIVVAAVGVVFIAVALVAQALIWVAIPLALFLGYALYAAPFLVVVEDRRALDALEASYDHATDLGPYASYGLQYVLLVAAVSLPASSFVRLGLPAVALAALATAPLSAVTAAATAAFVTDLADGDLDDVDGGDFAYGDDHPGGDGDGHPRGTDRDDDRRERVDDADDGVRGNHWADEVDENDGGGFGRREDDRGDGETGDDRG